MRTRWIRSAYRTPGRFARLVQRGFARQGATAQGVDAALIVGIIRKQVKAGRCNPRLDIKK